MMLDMIWLIGLKILSHVQRSSNFDVDSHNRHLENIEQVTQAGKDEQIDPSLRCLSSQPNFSLLNSDAKYRVEAEV